MDKVIYILGDSHTQSLDWDYNDSGWSEYYHDSKYAENGNFIFTRLDSKTAFNVDYDIEKLHDLSKYDEVIIMPHLGEVDIRFYLVLNDNVKDTVHSYVKKTIDKFSQHKIIFLGPVPPSKKEIITEEYYGTYLERVNKYNEFMFYLKLYSREYGLQDPIEIIDAFKTYVLDNNLYVSDGYHLDADYLKQIFEHIAKKI